MKIKTYLSHDYKKNKYSEIDIDYFLEVITHKSNNYYFYGNLEQNYYYISNNLKLKFGFHQNIVNDFMNKWINRIYALKDKQMFENSFKRVIIKKEKVLNLRYRIRDIYNNVSWIHFYGEVRYSENDEPINFVGYISQQDDYLLVDKVTGFPMESYLEEYLTDLKASNEDFYGIGIHFNHSNEICADKGREFYNLILSSTSNRLKQVLNDKLNFFKLNDSVILAILDSKYEEKIEDIVYMIRETARMVYFDNDIKIRDCVDIVVEKCSMTNSDFVGIIYTKLKNINSTYNDKLIGELTLNEKNKKISKMILQLNQDVFSNMRNFRIVVQPIVDKNTEKIVGAETLLRWKFMDKDVSPDIFIDMIEKQNLIQSVGRWVFQQAVDVCKEIVNVDENFYLSVNVSLHQLQDESFITFMKKTLEKDDLSSKNIVLELTETFMDDNSERVDEFIEECNRLGIKLALDDFGTGYSSLANLFKYQTQIVKIDRSLLLEMEVSSERKKFILSIMKTFKMIGKKIIVEGVETDAHKELIMKSDSDLIQGFYYYQPLEIKSIKEIYKLV